MRGSPANAAPEHRPISTTPKVRPQTPPPERVSASPHPKPKVLMGEVAAPKGQLIAAERDAFRAFMLAHRLTPSTWAAAAGVPTGQILAFLTGRARAISPAVAAKLAAAAGASVEDLFR
ncbi:MAG TPA: hypothetical protein VGC16_02070 [Rhizomicrobium sp.]